MLEFDVRIKGGDAHCVDEFTGSGLKETMNTRASFVMAAGDQTRSVAITPASTIVAVWDDIDGDKNLTIVEKEAATYFGVSGFDSIMSYDHLAALGSDGTKSKALEVMSTLAKVDSLIKLGGGYADKSGTSSEAAPRQSSACMQEAMAEYAYAGGGSKVFDFSSSNDTVAVLKGAITIYQSGEPLTSRRRALQQSDTDLSALADVMVTIFDTIESNADETDASAAIEAITKAIVAAETEIIKDVEDLAEGKVSASAFKEANTKERINEKVAATALPASLSEAISGVVPPAPPAPAPSPPTEEEKESSSKSDDTGMIIGIVFGVLAFTVIIVGGVFYSARRARNKRLTDDAGLPMTIDLSSTIYTPYNKKKEKKAKKYAPGGASSSSAGIEMTPVDDSQASAFA